jgi:hypothetical protein
MANVKITQLPLATTPLTGTEDIPLVQGTTTKQVTVTGLFTSPVMTNPTLGTVGQADLINATGLPISTGVAGLGTGIATFLGTPSSTNLRAAVTDETGTGSLVFATSPTLVTPNLGTPSVLVATNATGTAVGLTAGSAITNANLTGAVTSVGNATSLGSFTSAQLRTALTDETGAGSAVFATSPTITAPILNQINDTNNAQILGLSPTTSAVDYLVVKNGIGVGVPLHFYADGASANIGLHIQPKGTGLVTISDGTDFNKGIRFRSSSSAASAITLLDAVSTAGRVVTLPDATTTLVGRDTTDTLTNKTIAFSSNTFSGTLAIANGGTNASTAASAIQNLLPSYTGNGSKGLRLNSGATALEWVADGGGTVTSVAASVPSFLSIAGSPITTSGTLAISLSGTALPTTSGGTNLTSFTSGGVVYASSSSALATGSALTFDGSKLTVSATSGETGLLTATGVSNYLSIKGDTGGTTIWTGIGTDTGVSWLGSVSNHPISFRQNNTEGMRLTSTGLGIGTSSPAYKLDVVGSSRIGGDSPFLYIQDTVNPASDVGLYLGAPSAATYAGLLTNFSSDQLLIRHNSATVATFSSAGNLGIGTSSPGAKLDVAGSGYIRGDSTNATFTDAGQLAIKRSTSSPFMSFHGDTGTRVGYIQMSSSGASAIVVQANQALTFATNDTERARIPSTGGIQSVNSISVGNATPTTSGAGITFPATQSASSNANTLDDYEEGTFTPALTGTGITYGIQVGRYVKIGKLVQFQIAIAVTAATTISTPLTGLPFTSAAGDDSAYGMNVNLYMGGTGVQFPSTYTYPSFYVNRNATTIDLAAGKTGAAASTVTLTSSANMYIAGTYITTD